MSDILLVADNQQTLSILRTLLKTEGYSVETATAFDKAWDAMGKAEYEVMLCDVSTDVAIGMEFVQRSRGEKPEMPVIAIIPDSLGAGREKASDPSTLSFVVKPLKVDELLRAVQRVIESKDSKGAGDDVELEFGLASRFESLVTKSATMRQVCQLIERVAPTDIGVLIWGESGTEKRTVAEAIHGHSNRKGKTMLALNCLDCPEELIDSELFGHVRGAFEGAKADKTGLFEAAAGGSAFLDDIDAMPAATQEALVAALKAREFKKVGGKQGVPLDVRFLTASTKDLGELVRDGKFHKDLHISVSGVAIEVKPLRDRREDILPMVEQTLKRVLGDGAEAPKLSPQLGELLQKYAWPGNVAEVESMVRRLVQTAQGKPFSPAMLPPEIRRS